MAIGMTGMCASSVPAQVPVDDSKWALIGDPGNRNNEGDEIHWPWAPPSGSVDYEYRISRLEVTIGEYLEFVIAYAPIYFQNNPDDFYADLEFSGLGIRVTRIEIEIRGTNPDRPTTMGWDYAARYANWIHNGKVLEEWAYETGVFDASTFAQQDGEDWEPQEFHSDQARYWIPTKNEWTKAAYWDPNKLGEGVGGYRLYPNGTDRALRPNLLPDEGGQRNAGEDSTIFPLSVGSFADQVSPWGVLDLAGGESEWTEFFHLNVTYRRGLMGSEWRSVFYNEPPIEFVDDLDRLGTPSSSTVRVPRGLRLATGLFHPVDLNQDGRVNYFDISAFIRLFVAGDDRADFRLDGQFDFDDVRVFLGLMNN